MSLINDALKRASQSEKNRPRAAGLPAAMQPAPDRRRSNVPMLIGAWIFVSLAVAAWFFWPQAPRPNVESSLRLDPGGSAPPPAAISTNGSARSADATYAAAPLPASASTNVSGGAAAPPYPASPAPTPTAFPELKLQGIFYSPGNPRATINGQMKGENEKIGDVRIVTITQKKVTVQWNGQTRDLLLGDN